MIPLRKAGAITGLGLLSLGAAAIALNGCGGGHNSIPISTPTPTPTATPSTGTGRVTVTVPANTTVNAGLQPTGSTVTLNFAIPGVTQGPVSVDINSMAQASLPVPITRAAASTHPIPGKSRGFTGNPNNVFVAAFTISVTPQGSFTFTAFPSPVLVSGSSGSLFPPFTVLNIAQLQSNNSWNDVATLITDSTGHISPQQATAVLRGILTPGTYVIYKPAPGTSTAVSNFGVALLADEQGDGRGLQVVNLYDANSNPLATPTIQNLPYQGASDLDGQALTPDGSQGILVDGSNKVLLFSGVDSGHPTASSTVLDVSQYGGDGDSIAIMPNGDTAIVALDTNNDVEVVTGITSGNPHVAGTIPAPNPKDGVAISADGKVLLARSSSSLTVYSITPAASGSALPYTFTQTADLPALAAQGIEDGRDGMAFSPIDSSTAVVLAGTFGSPQVTVLTGLPNAPVTRTVTAHLPAHAPSTYASYATRADRAKEGRAVVTGATELFSVAVDFTGKLAVVGTDSGLVLFSGVDTGNLQQVGSIFAPTITPLNGTAAPISGVSTLAITLDNKYVIAGVQGTDASHGTLLTIPFSASGFSAPVGQLNDVSIPDNDQLLVH